MMPGEVNQPGNKVMRAVVRTLALVLAAVVVTFVGLVWLRSLSAIGDGAASPAASGLASQIVSQTSPTASVVAPTATPEPAATLTPVPTGVTPVPTGYTVSIATGLHPHWTAAAAASAVIGRIFTTQQVTGRVLAEPRIISVEGMAGKDVSRAASGPFPEYSIVWVVHARGTFWGQWSPGTAGLFGNDAWIVYDDDGNEVGSGFVSDTPAK